MKEILFELILNKHPETLRQNYISIDLLPTWDKDKYNQSTLALLDTDVFIYLKSGYICEIRENRYLTILVDEWSKIKLDIQAYIRDNKINNIL